MASVRSGNYAQALALWPLVNTDAQETCAYYLARHDRPEMGAMPLRPSPVGICWDMLDELTAISRWRIGFLQGRT